MKCNNCGKEFDSPYPYLEKGADYGLFCPECKARIDAADAEKEYYEAKKWELERR